MADQQSFVFGPKVMRNILAGKHMVEKSCLLHGTGKQRTWKGPEKR
jgi:hypothetical protein